jgi:DNA-binding LacI/PurR family transcriptional regulator
MEICISKKKYTANTIAADIESYIYDTGQKNNTPLATSKSLARKYNVSVMTINRAVSKLVEKGLVYRIQGKGTFVAKQTAHAKNKLIGYFTWQLNDHTPLNEAAYGTFENIVQQGLNDSGFKVDFIIRPGYRKEIISFSEAIKYDLLIIPSGMITPHTLPWLKRLSVPIIVINHSEILPYPFHQVCHYLDQGFEVALNYLKKRGENKIFIAGIKRLTSELRVKALRNTADAMGIIHETIPEREGLTEGTSITVLRGREVGKYFLDNNLKGVIFALSDFIAMGIIDVVKERGLELGQDVKIISYDNLESRVSFGQGEAQITSITHPLKELAEETVKLAEDIITNNIKDSSVTKIIKVPAKEFVVRKSFY